MSTDFLEKIEKLPADKKKEVEDFVDFLIAKSNPEVEISSNEKPKSGFGSMKGLIKFMAEDFDAPLEDFKDYM
jgi:hypothetical protein